MIGLQIAPGLNRDFMAENWEMTPKRLWEKARAEAREKIRTDAKLMLQGYDIDERALRVARANARLAGVEGQIHFQKRDVRELSSADKYGFIVTNPPYGERLQDTKSVELLYKDMGKVLSKLDTWSFYIITANEGFERLFGRRADKKRKLYNGMLKTDFYQFFGPKPPRAEKEMQE